MLKGKSRLSHLLNAVRKQLAAPANPREWGAGLKSDLEIPADGSDGELWEDTFQLFEGYVDSGETELLWRSAVKLRKLATWYRRRPVTVISGVGEKRAESLENLGVRTVEDLVFHYPRAYTDRRYVDDIADVREEKYYTLYGEVLATGVVEGRRPRFEIRLGDDTGYIRINFWNQAYLQKKITTGDELFCYGKAEFFRGKPQVNNPEFDLISDSDDLDSSRGIKPVYPLTEGISQRLLRDYVEAALEFCSDLFLDNIPPEIRSERQLARREKSLVNVHSPESQDRLESARRRLIFEEFFFFQLVFALHNWKIDSRCKGRSYPSRELRDRFLSELPFELTADQEAALEDIEADLTSDSPAHRLLQGDVGTGKTVVAAAAMARAAENNYQTALMAPTEVLAEQHYETLSELFGPVECNVELLTGRLKKSEKDRVRGRLESGDLDVVVGTHALIQGNVEFSQLGFVVVDEQHRFGVDQRRKLREKGPDVDMLIMSATPIPRSLALTVYGDLDVSSIREFPKQRRRVNTAVLEQTKENRLKVFRKVRKLVKSGQRAFLVFPAIEASDNSDLTAAEDAYRKACDSEIFSDLSPGLLHGRMNSEEKQDVMQKFRTGEVGVLFSTTVVEVGVDVPEAGCLVVFEAERFGLAQLHQLRGRIGRAGQKAHCFLLADPEVAPGSRERLEVLEETADGLEVAREDLQFRGMGAPTGTRQSGWQEFELGNVWEHRELMGEARDSARDLVERTDGLSAPGQSLVRDALETEYKEQMHFARIG